MSRLNGIFRLTLWRLRIPFRTCLHMPPNFVKSPIPHTIRQKRKAEISTRMASQVFFINLDSNITKSIKSASQLGSPLVIQFVFWRMVVKYEHWFQTDRYLLRVAGAMPLRRAFNLSSPMTRLRGIGKNSDAVGVLDANPSQVLSGLTVLLSPSKVTGPPARPFSGKLRTK